MLLTQCTCRRVPFLRATNFANGANKGVRGNYFHKTTLATLFIIHINLHTMELLLLFGEINFVEVPKICEIDAREERAPYGTLDCNEHKVDNSDILIF